jgi:hypothetical protein
MCSSSTSLTIIYEPDVIISLYKGRKTEAWSISSFKVTVLTNRREFSGSGSWIFPLPHRDHSRVLGTWKTENLSKETSQYNSGRLPKQARRTDRCCPGSLCHQTEGQQTTCVTSWGKAVRFLTAGQMLDRVSGDSTRRQILWLLIFCSRYLVVSLHFPFSRTIILFPGHSEWSKFLFLFLACCFVKQTLWRGDQDEDVPFPATMETPSPSLLTFSALLHYVLLSAQKASSTAA